MPWSGPPDLAATAREILERIILRCGSLRGAGVGCGHSVMWIWRQLRQNKSVDLVKVAKVLGHLAVPPRVFLEEVADTLPAYDPVWVLEHFFPRGGPRDPFLTSLENRFRRLLKHPLTPSARTSCRIPEIEALEEKCLDDRKAAKAELEVFGRDVLISAEAALAGDRGLARGNLVACARLLFVWAAVQRSAGSRDDSADALALAYRFGLATRDYAVLGLFFHEGAQLLSELGQPGHALRFAQAAARHFQTLRDRKLDPKALFQLSQAFAQLGQHAEARIHAIATLRLSGRDQRRTRAPAWLQLADLAMVRGNFSRAFGLLERAKANARANSCLKAFIHGRQAVTLAHLGRRSDAPRAFRSASRIFERDGETLEILNLAVDLAEALIVKGRRAETLALVRGVAPHFERWDHDTQASSLWLDLCALILDGRRNGLREQVRLVREALAKAGGPAFAAAGPAWARFLF